MEYLSENDLSVMKYYKEGKVLCGFEGVHTNLWSNFYLDGDLELTEKGRKFINEYPKWDSVKTFDNKTHVHIKLQV